MSSMFGSARNTGRRRTPFEGDGAGSTLRYGVVVFALALLLGACSTTHYREAADRETYNAIKAKTAAVPGMDTAFTIEEPVMPPLDGLPGASDPPEYLGEAAQTEKGAHVITLEKALEWAVQHNAGEGPRVGRPA
ncbi:MAG: hypothetical protein NTU83_07915 [Candidatus Hydrogenedentes bacterium]|nr:hypothetical protein [Candidatus Hydrogenedentota bacterium]